VTVCQTMAKENHPFYDFSFLSGPSEI
jgi:hypothetical protein